MNNMHDNRVFRAQDSATQVSTHDWARLATVPLNSLANGGYPLLLMPCWHLWSLLIVWDGQITDRRWLWPLISDDWWIIRLYCDDQWLYLHVWLIMDETLQSCEFGTLTLHYRLSIMGDGFVWCHELRFCTRISVLLSPEIQQDTSSLQF